MLVAETWEQIYHFAIIFLSVSFGIRNDQAIFLQIISTGNISMCRVTVMKRKKEGYIGEVVKRPDPL